MLVLIVPAGTPGVTETPSCMKGWNTPRGASKILGLSTYTRTTQYLPLKTAYTWRSFVSNNFSFLILILFSMGERSLGYSKVPVLDITGVYICVVVIDVIVYSI